MDYIADSLQNEADTYHDVHKDYKYVIESNEAFEAGTDKEEYESESADNSHMLAIPDSAIPE